jgi:hypothetical protein
LHFAIDHLRDRKLAGAAPATLAAALWLLRTAFFVRIPGLAAIIIPTARWRS